MGEKVISFPAAGTKLSGGDATFSRQLNLFDFSAVDQIFVSFLDVDRLRHDELIDFIAKNSVGLVFDLRDRAIFDRSKFNHKEILSYFYNRNIDYLEFSIFVDGFRGTEYDAYIMFESLFKESLGRTSSGGRGVIFLFDFDCVNSGVLNAFRSGIMKSGKRFIERMPKL